METREVHLSIEIDIVNVEDLGAVQGAAEEDLEAVLGEDGAHVTEV